jgi:hypothetical protein
MLLNPQTTRNPTTKAEMNNLIYIVLFVSNMGNITSHSYKPQSPEGVYHTPPFSIEHDSCEGSEWSEYIRG